MLASVLFAAPAAAMELSFDRAVEMIVAESHDIKKADAGVRRAQAGLDSANANRWFKLEGSATYMNIINMDNPGKPVGIAMPADLGGVVAGGGMAASIPSFIEFPDNIAMAGVTLTQPIYTFGKIGNAADAARGAIGMLESGRDLARSEVKYAAAQIYWTAKMTDGMVAIAEKNLKASNDAQRLLTAAGRANRINLVKISADISAKEIALSDAKFNRDSAYRLLKILAGIGEDEDVALTTPFPEKFNELDAPSALSANPEWDMLEAKAKSYDASAASRRAAHYPTLAATASYNWVATHTDYQVWQGRKTQAANWGVALSVPIFDGGLARANATMDAMDAESARQDLDKSRKLKSNEYNDAVLKYGHLVSNMDALGQARNLAERAAGISRDRFAAGQTGAVELSEVQAAVAQMDTAVLNAKFNILMAEENVKKLMAEGK